MISYHPESAGRPIGTPYSQGFEVADTDDVERIAAGIARFAWSPAIFKGGHRLNKNFLYADWIGLDFETAEFSLDQALKTFCDVTHIIGTTRNHRVPKDGLTLDRFRVVLKLPERISDAAYYKWTLMTLILKYDADDTGCDPARHFFRCREIVSKADLGDTITVPNARSVPQSVKESLVEVDPEQYRLAIRTRTIKHQAGKPLAPWLIRFLRDGRCLGEQRNRTAFAAAISLLEVGYGPDEIGDMIWQSPFEKVRGNDPFTQHELRRVVANAEKFVARRLHVERDQDAGKAGEKAGELLPARQKQRGSDS